MQHWPRGMDAHEVIIAELLGGADGAEIYNQISTLAGSEL